MVNLQSPETTQVSSPKYLGELPIYSFFTGAGFLDLGFEKVGFETSMANEIHLPFMQGFEYSRSKFPKAKATSNLLCSIDDILSGKQKLPTKTDKSVPLGFIGGPPCPDFSVAGKQKGQSGDNGKLTGTYAQLICDQSPDWFLLENVKGLWKTKKHRAFYDDICNRFIAEGYCLTDRLINSIEYGVPQDRERIILLGFKSKLINKRRAKFLDNKEFPWDFGVKYQKENVFSRPWPLRDPCGSNPQFDQRCLKRLTVEHWFNKNRVSDHPNSIHTFVARAGLKKFETIDEGDDSGKSYKRLHRWRYSPTAAYGNNEVHIHPYEPRRISVSEALAIQSLPEQFSLPANMTLSNMFKTIGNGVPYLASVGLAESIQKYLSRF